jgi:catechol 2,3-dioxygenase-like lactoylglutathione lyase family enzyme
LDVTEPGEAFFSTLGDGNADWWKLRDTREYSSAKENDMELYRGRLVDHIQLVTRDLASSRRFYEAILGVLGIPIEGGGDGYFWADELVVSSADSEAADGELTGRVHLAFQAQDRAMVEAFHKEGLSAGGRDNGSPGERSYHPGYFAAFLLDPDSNNIEVVHHGAAERSAENVTITVETMEKQG